MGMDNEVVINVRAKDHTDTVFAAVRAKAKRLGDEDLTLKAKIKDETGPWFDSIKDRTKKLGDDVDKTLRKSGQKAGQSIAEEILSSFGQMTPQMLEAGAALAAVLAPQIGATIAGAVVGTAGFTGVIGGLALAATDSRVQTVAKSIGEQVTLGLKSSALGFVSVAVEALEKVKVAWRGLAPTIQSIFIQSAKFVAPLTDGLIRMGTRIVEGIEIAVGRAGPVMEAFGDMFAEVGDAVGDLFEKLSEDSETGAGAIRDLGEIVGGLIRDFGGLSHELSKIKEEWDMWQEAFRKSDMWLEDHISWLDVTRDGYDKNTEAAELYRKGIIGAAGSANDYNHYLKEQEQAQKGAIDAAERHTEALQTLAAEMQKQTDPLFAIFDLQTKVNKAQEAYTKALGEGGPNSAKARKALLDMGKAGFELNTALGEATEGFNGKLTPAMRTALRNAGLTKKEIDQLEKELINARKAAEKWEGEFTQTFRIREIITTKGERTYGGGGGRQAPVMDRGQSGKIKGAASGMVTGNLTWVGESGPELVRLPPGAHVNSNPDSERMASMGASRGIPATGGDGAAAPVVVNLLVDDVTIATAILPSLQRMNRQDYAGDVTRMFPAVR